MKIFIARKTWQLNDLLVLLVNFFSFIYTDQAKIDDGNVKDLLYAAKKYAIKGLVNKCLAFLESSVNTLNVCSILEMVCNKKIWNLLLIILELFVSV